MRLKSQNEVEVNILKDKINSGNYPNSEIKKIESEMLQHLFYNSVINNALNFFSFKNKGGTRKQSKKHSNKTKKVRFNI